MRRPASRNSDRRRLIRLVALVPTGTVVAACAQGEHAVTGVNVPPPLATSTTARPSTTAPTTTAAPTTTEAPPETLQPTTTVPPADSGPPVSIDTEYAPGTGRDPRTPCVEGPDLGQLVQGANCRHVIVDGVVREYIVYVPANLDRKDDAPLVVYLHGDDGTGDESLRPTGWKKRADEDGMLVAFPTSLVYQMKSGVPTGWTFRWNGFELGELIEQQRIEGYPSAAPLPADDTTFINDMIADIEYKWPVDPAKVFAVGVQSGADLVMKMTLAQPELFAAVAMSAGGVSSPTHELPTPTRAVPMMLLLGTEDKAYGEMSIGDDASLDPTIPLRADDFVASDVGTYTVSRLASVTGTDPGTPTKKDDDHLTRISFDGFGIGGGTGLFVIEVFEGLTSEYPVSQNNLAGVFGTVLIWNFFVDQIPAD